MSNKLISEYFSVDEQGNWFGYHVEGGETFDNSNGVSIEKGMFRNDKPFFLCNNYHEWFPMHLKDRDTYRIFKVTFTPVKELIIKSWEEYQNQFVVNEITVNGKLETVTSYTKDGLEKQEAGFQVLVVPKDNLADELTEGVLMFPKTNILKVELLGSCELIINDHLTNADNKEVAAEVSEEKDTGELLVAVESAEAAM